MPLYFGYRFVVPMVQWVGPMFLFLILVPSVIEDVRLRAFQFVSNL
jgi:hypothetical protein